MEEKLIINSFRYYKKEYDLFSKFDLKLSNFHIRIIELILHFIFFLRVDKLLGLCLNKLNILSKEEIFTITLSENHQVIADRLYELGFEFQTISFNSKKNSLTNTLKVPRIYILLGIIKNARLIINIIHEVKGSNDIVILNNIPRLLMLRGMLEIFKKLKGSSVVIKFNDHSPSSVLLYDICELFNIKTVYIQHAPVSTRFPRLYHDLNVLFSFDSLQKYKKPLNPLKKIIELFDVRFPERYNKVGMNYPKNKNVLICTNLLDNINPVLELAEILKEYGFDITLRPHPADRRNWRAKFWKLSRIKNIWDELTNVSYVITNESAVILEGIYGGKFVYKCATFSQSLDNYGFLKIGLLHKEYNELLEMTNDINNGIITYDISKLSYFIGNFDEQEVKLKFLKNEISNLRNEVRI